MFLKIDQQLERCRRVIRQRVRPRIHPVLRHLDVEMFDIPGEPMPTDEFFAGLRRGEIPFEPFTMGSQWDTTWGTIWFKLSGQVPEGKPDGRPLELWIDLGWYDHSCGGHIEGLVYRADGTAIKAVHPLNHWVPLIAADGAAQVELDAEGRFTVYLEAASNPLLLGVPPFIETELGDHATGRPDEPYTFRAALAGVLSRRANASAMDISAIGHAHIDSAWLWPVRETRRKVARTVANALALMDDDPEFKYTMSSAQQYAWLEQDHPDIFARMKERIAVGRGSVALPKVEAIAEAIARTWTESRTLAGECLTLLDGAEQWNGIGACLRDDQSDPIIVTGPFADDMACFLGDYTAPLERTQITSVYRQLRERFGERVLLSADGTGLEGADWLNAAAAVAVLGGTSERSYDSAFADNGAAAAVAEHGATCGEGVDLCDVTLLWGQDALLDRVRELTEAPVVSVVVSGRAHVLTHVLEVSDATLWAGYAGPYGPQSVVEALVGDAGMPGRLPVTLPAYAGAVPVRYNDRQSAEHVYRDAEEPVLLPFGFGEGSVQGVSCEDLKVTASGESLHLHLKLHTDGVTDPGTLNVFVRRVGGTRIPRLAQLAASVYVRDKSRGQWDVDAEVPVAALMDEADRAMRIHLWVGTAIPSDECEVVLERGNADTVYVRQTV